MELQPLTVTLSEHILNDDLHRPLQYTERVRDIVLRWSHWPEADRKSNILMLQPLNYMLKVQRVLQDWPFVWPKNVLHFADCKTILFKPCTFDIKNDRVTVMRNFLKVCEIDLTMATAYLGCERKRSNFQWGCAITLIGNDANSSILRLELL